MRFRCGTCGEEHQGTPSFGWDFPVQYLSVPETERGARCILTSDTCEIDGQWFFVRGCLEIPVIGEEEAFSWGVWTSLSEKNFRHFIQLYEERRRAQHGPFFGWLCSHIPVYPETLNLKTMVHLRDDGLRPYVELEPTEHPLAAEQRNGITPERVAEIYERVMHPPRQAG
ncbi:MAG: DUF2199 domain-containing protein [Gemmatimonadaceae bacterium]